MRLHL